MRWRPLSAHSRKRRTSDKSLTQSFDALRSSKWRFSSCRFSFCRRCCLTEVSHPQQYSTATRNTVVPMNIEVPMKYPLSHNDRIVVLEIRLHGESPMLYRPALRGNWNALSLTRRVLNDKFPTPTIPLTAVLTNRQVFLLTFVVSFKRLRRIFRLSLASDVLNQWYNSCTKMAFSAVVLLLRLSYWASHSKISVMSWVQKIWTCRFANKVFCTDSYGLLIFARRMSTIFSRASKSIFPFSDALRALQVSMHL